METTVKRGNRKKRMGIVVSDRMQKTIVVRVEQRVRHPVYLKEITQSQKFHVHDERGEAKTGDVVEIVETRPLSRTKRWRLVRVVKAGSGVKASVESGHDNAENQS
jgi:small subunit ribosomal protein S17